MITGTRLSIVEATPQHAPFIAWVTLTAFRSHLERGFWDFMLDGEEAYKLRCLESLATTEQLHWVHYSTFIVAEVDGRPVSALSGYVSEELGGPTLRMAAIEANQKMGRTEEEGAAGFERAKSIMNVIPEHVSGAWNRMIPIIFPENRNPSSTVHERNDHSQPPLAARAGSLVGRYSARCVSLRYWKSCESA